MLVFIAVSQRTGFGHGKNIKFENESINTREKDIFFFLKPWILIIPNGCIYDLKGRSTKASQKRKTRHVHIFISWLIVKRHHRSTMKPESAASVTAHPCDPHLSAHCHTYSKYITIYINILYIMITYLIYIGYVYVFIERVVYEWRIWIVERNTGEAFKWLAHTQKKAHQHQTKKKIRKIAMFRIPDFHLVEYNSLGKI